MIGDTLIQSAIYVHCAVNIIRIGIAVCCVSRAIAAECRWCAGTNRARMTEDRAAFALTVGATCPN